MVCCIFTERSGLHLQSSTNILCVVLFVMLQNSDSVFAATSRERHTQSKNYFASVFEYTCIACVISISQMTAVETQMQNVMEMVVVLDDC